MKYINMKTGYLLNSECECFGGDWELLQEVPSLAEADTEVKEKKKPKKKAVKKNDK